MFCFCYLSDQLKCQIWPINDTIFLFFPFGFLHFPFVFSHFPFVFLHFPLLCSFISHLCSPISHSCSLIFHSWSLLFHSCSPFPIRVNSCSIRVFYFHSCSIRVHLFPIHVPFVFSIYHSCSLVFHPCTHLCGVLDMIPDFCWFRKSDRVNTLKMNDFPTHGFVSLKKKTDGNRTCSIFVRHSS